VQQQDFLNTSVEREGEFLASRRSGVPVNGFGVASKSALSISAERRQRCRIGWPLRSSPTVLHREHPSEG
jgi:hypothetical protein